MSSFKRKTAAAEPPPPAGTRALGSGTLVTSMGVASLDDLLGGGLPLGATAVVLAPEPHSAYGALVARYALAQGVAAQHTVVVVGGAPRAALDACMWLAAGGAQDAEAPADEGTRAQIKIAWRYEGMAPFRTTVDDARTSGADGYCGAFDLTARMPAAFVDDAIAQGRIVLCDISAHVWEEQPLQRVLRELQAIADAADAAVPLRIIVPELGAPEWGDVSSRAVLRFLRSLRALTRAHGRACAVVALAPHVSADGWGGAGWADKVGWMADACLTLAAFTADPALAAAFPTQHGLVRLHALPAAGALVPASDRTSALRALGGGGENNLGFRCMRKRLLFETVHLGAEGGVGERRTAPPPSSSASVVADAGHAHAPIGGAGPALEVRVEGGPPEPPAASPKKAKKRVAFRADQTDMYDF